MRASFLVITGLLWLAGLAGSARAASAEGSPDAQAMWEFVSHQVRFQPFCFEDSEFPACDFDDPRAVEELIGPYSIAAAFYDADGKQVTAAESPGRYGAVVEVTRSGGIVSRRFVTLVRLAKSPARTDAGGERTFMSPALVEAAGVDRQVFEDQGGEFERVAGARVPRAGGRTSPATAAARSEAAEAVMLAGLCDLTSLKAAGQPLPSESLSRLDRQWWVAFKRVYYGCDRMYPAEFVCPETVEGMAAPMLHEGTPAEAGMAEDSVARIDAACEKWVNEIGVGFSLCVARHGVVVLNKGYGAKADEPQGTEPFAADTAGPLASCTKFLSAVLLAEFVDEGLIGLDEPVGVYLPRLKSLAPKTAARPLTVRDCYLHIGGFHGQAGDLMNDLEEIVADLYPTLDVGLRHEYDGMGLALGGKIMEMVGGESIPRLYNKHLFGPLGCTDTDVELTAYGSMSTALDLARVGQMTLNGGAYGNKRFFRPGALASMMPTPGRDRFLPDTAVRWGVGIKQFDIDGLSDSAYGHPGATGSCVVVDPSLDLVIAMVRFTEGPDFRDFLRRKAAMYKAIVDCIEE